MTDTLPPPSGQLPPPSGEPFRRYLPNAFGFHVAVDDDHGAFVEGTLYPMRRDQRILIDVEGTYVLATETGASSPTSFDSLSDLASKSSWPQPVMDYLIKRLQSIHP